MNRILLASVALLLTLFVVVLFYRLPKATRQRIRIATIWVSGLLIVLALSILWLVSLGLAIYTLYRARGEVEAGSYVGI